MFYWNHLFTTHFENIRRKRFFCKFVLKNRNCQFKLKFGTYTNSKMVSMMVFILSVLNWKYSSRSNLVQKIKTDSLNWNLVPSVMDKISGTKQRNPVKLGRTRKVWYLFLRVFWLLFPKFNFWKGDWALGYAFTKIGEFSNIF